MAGKLDRGISIFLGAILIFFLKGSSAAQEEPGDIFKKPKIEYSAQDLDDPFASKEEKVKPAEEAKKAPPQRPLPAFKVQGIIWGGYMPQAIVNDKVVRVNDIIEEARIVDIGQDGITVIFDDLEYKISAPAAGYRKVEENPKGGTDEE